MKLNAMVRYEVDFSPIATTCFGPGGYYQVHRTTHDLPDNSAQIGAGIEGNSGQI
eukprot:COSAG04_NODE_29882_length_266_cov_0.616766_1_plen_55_part_01